MSLPNKCIIDTNVPKIANLATQPDESSDIPGCCMLACIDAIEHVIKQSGLVIDAGDEIFDEYRKQLSLKGQPGVGDKFLKWVHTNRWKWEESQRVTITQQGESYEEFPKIEGLLDFDISDKKFVAVANSHPKKPPILQASDSKWWGWKVPLQEAGITVIFLCPDYIKNKFDEKVGHE